MKELLESEYSLNQDKYMIRVQKIFGMKVGIKPFILAIYNFINQNLIYISLMANIEVKINIFIK